MGRFSTKDLELSEKLQNEGCVVKDMTEDPADKALIHIFEESESEINKILGVKAKEVATEEKAEILPEVNKKKAGKRKKKRR